MKLSTLFGSRSLKPQWSFTAAHVLWRFLVSDDGLILGEERDTEAKTVSFFCLEMGTGTVLWRDRTFGESWWTGIEALIGDRLYLHGFAQPDMPEHHGLTSLDARTGTVLWQNADISFYAADAATVIGYRDLFERRVFERFDAATGACLGELATAGEDIDAMRSRTFGRTDFTFAQPMTAGDAEQAVIEKALTKHTDAMHREPVVEFAKSGNSIIFSAHLARIPVHAGAAPSLKNILCVINGETGKEEFTEVLNNDTPYPVPDSFFIDKDVLYYIKEKQTLCAVRIV